MPSQQDIASLPNRRGQVMTPRSSELRGMTADSPARPSTRVPLDPQSQRDDRSSPPDNIAMTWICQVTAGQA
jgi:hypothetical protein